MPAMTVFIWLIVNVMLFRHEFRVFRSIMFIKKAAHGIQIRVHSAGFADGLAWLFGLLQNSRQSVWRFHACDPAQRAADIFPDRRREGGRESESTRPWSMARRNKARDWPISPRPSISACVFGKCRVSSRQSASENRSPLSA